MDESEIQAKLKENVPHPEFKENEQYHHTPEEEAEMLHNSLPLDNYVLRHQVFDFMDIPVTSRSDPTTSGAIDTILEWAYKQTGSREFADLIHVINRQEAVMGSRRSDDRLARLYQFVKINKQMEALAEQERALYGS